VSRDRVGLGVQVESPTVALLVVTSAFSAMLLSANLATPLYAVYAMRFGFSTMVLALIVAVYAIVLIPSLLLFGQVSDRLGRRAVVAMGWLWRWSRCSCSP
jgi:MFS family permease